MKILYITQFYPPETGAGSVRAHEFSCNWSKAGEYVMVLTGFPNYPRGEIYPGFKNKIYEMKNLGNISIVRTFTYVPEYKSIFLRIINQVIFSFFSLYGGLKITKPDLIIATSPPFGIGMIGYLLSHIWGAKFVFEVRDLFPESAIAFGILNNWLLIRCLKVIEKFYYHKADLIIGATQGICDFIESLGIPHQKIRKITNGVNTDVFQKLPETGFREDHHLEGRFVVLYTGIHGRAENLSTLIEAARILKKEEYIHFVLIGDGVEKQSLISLKEKYGLENVHFLDTQPANKMPYILASSDVCFSSRKDVNVNCGALPVKIFEYMACEKPVVVCIKGEAEKLVRDGQAGVCIDPDDPKALAEAIYNLSRDNKLLERYGKNSRAYVSRFYNRKKLAADYLNSLSEIWARLG